MVGATVSPSEKIRISIYFFIMLCLASTLILCTIHHGCIRPLFCLLSFLYLFIHSHPHCHASLGRVERKTAAVLLDGNRFGVAEIDPRPFGNFIGWLTFFRVAGIFRECPSDNQKSFASFR